MTNRHEISGKTTIPHERRRALTLLAATPFAQAQNKPIRLIVPYPAGGPLDVDGARAGRQGEGQLGTVVVENRPAPAATSAPTRWPRPRPTALTIVMGAVATHAINPWLYAKMPYDPLRDFTPITLVAQVPNVLVMNVDTAQRLRHRHGAPTWSPMRRPTPAR